LILALAGLPSLKLYLNSFPGADYAYFGDTARLPYGSKSVETVARYAVEAAHYLESQGAQMLVIACNTATALALDRITAGAHVPVVGVIEPGAEAAAAASKNQKIVVIGTEATVSSHAYRKALEGSRPACERESLPAAGSAGRRRMGRASGHRAGRAHLSRGGFCGRIWRCRYAGSGLHALSAAQAAAAAGDAGACEHRGFGGVDGARRGFPAARVGARDRSTAEERRGAPRLKFFATDSWRSSGGSESGFWGIPLRTCSMWI
jgi:hypothetical protein